MIRLSNKTIQIVNGDWGFEIGPNPQSTEMVIKLVKLIYYKI
jgi:hypothetical protein